MILVMTMFALAASGDKCPAALAVLPPTGVCVEGPSGAVVSTDENLALETLGFALEGEARFRLHFASEVPPYVYIHARGKPDWAALQQAGFDVVVSLPSVDMTGDAITLQMRDRATRQAGGVPLTAQGEQQLRALTRRLLADMEQKQRGFVPHELGHQWFKQVFWRNSPLPLDGYGSAAPDWLDEAAAILMEDEETTRYRRLEFWRLWGRAGSTESVASRGQLSDLSQMLARRHPAMVLEASSGPILVPDQDPTDSFYSQIRLFLDYLIERTGDPAILVPLTEALAGGIAFETWLSTNTAGLPSSVEAMQEAWSAWLREQAEGR